MTASFRYGACALAVASISVAGCGGIAEGTGTNDASASDASSDGSVDAAIDVSTDAPIDASTTDSAPSICDGTGAITDESYKQCTTAAECTFYSHQTDCCGTTVITGVTKGSLAAVKTCESIWDKHFPGCGCAAGEPKTDDGKTTMFGATPTVTCGDFTSGGGICLTSTP
jgi:hypothetical protein